MTERDGDADELSAVDKLSTGDRLKAARKKRLAQLKKYQQYERQLDKEIGRKSGSAAAGAAGATSGGRGKKAAKLARAPPPPQRSAPRVQFVSNVVLLEAAARNDIVEGTARATRLITSVFDFRDDHARKPQLSNAYTQGDADVISFHIYASWFSPPSCG